MYVLTIAEKRNAFNILSLSLFTDGGLLLLLQVTVDLWMTDNDCICDKNDAIK